MPAVEEALEFRGPGQSSWRSLSAASDAEESLKIEVNRNKEELRGALLTSLQMQNLVVLAGSGCSLSAGGPSMQDLWIAAVVEDPTGTAEATAAKVNHDLTITNIELLLSRIEAYLQVNDDAEVKAFLDASKQVILDKCSEFIRPEGLGAHKTFLHRLYRRRVRDPRLRVFTTNYDLCFEKAAGELGGVTLDGFSFVTPRCYDPRYFGYDIIRRPRNSDDLGSFLEGVFLLYKLHGSVNWARSVDGTIIEKGAPNPDEACLIYPASGKYQQSFIQPHLESMAQYLSSLREPNSCVVIMGFGFNDDHLSEPILAAARSNPHLRIIIVDPDTKGKIAGGSGSYWGQFSALGMSGEDVWFISANFEEFSQMIPDLKSLTPADALMKAVQGVVRPG